MPTKLSSWGCLIYGLLLTIISKFYLMLYTSRETFFKTGCKWGANFFESIFYLAIKSGSSYTSTSYHLYQLGRSTTPVFPRYPRTLLSVAPLQPLTKSIITGPPNHEQAPIPPTLPDLAGSIPVSKHGESLLIIRLHYQYI